MPFFARWLEGGRRQRAATAVGLEADVLKECPVCRDITDAMQPDLLPRADAIAEEWLGRGDARVYVFRHDEAALKQAVRDVIEKSAAVCTCENIG